jgi:EAL domain-containing protein (putative c-di-GMP-specific phosphodiesterase class I)
MERWNINPAKVLIEIPETVEVVDADTLDALRTLGVRLAIDDVGCQYSNLERMVDIKADVAKLDRRWIPDLATAESSTSEVLRGLVGQCRALGFDLIAEGVETEDQLEMLRNLGIDVFQGYLFGRPVSPTDFERNWRDSTSSTDRGQAEVVGAGASDRP